MENITHKLIGMVGVRNEMADNPDGEANMGISVGVSSNDQIVISFANLFSISLPEADVDALRDLLYEGSRAAQIQKIDREFKVGMSQLTGDSTNCV